MTGKTIVIKRYEPFVLGICKCGCGQSIELKSKTNFTLVQWAPKHYFRYYNKNHYTNKTNSKCHNWRGGVYITEKGYKTVKINKKNVLLHRFIYESYHACCILPWIDIHHINENKLNNHISNLQLLSRSAHAVLSGMKDLSSNRCIICKSDKTYMQKKKNGVMRPHWLYDKNKNPICIKCHRREKKKII
jgi:hypothetical protein